MKWSSIVGIDEAGRGPLAGPITLAALALPKGFRMPKMKFAIKDSKQMPEERRNEVFRLLKNLKKGGQLDFSVSHVSYASIDRYGISKCTRLGIRRCLKKLAASPQETRVLLDGTLYAPDEFIHQSTIIKGDEKVKIIALSPILAKVYRDRRMVNLAKKFPAYGLEIHKGYGTKNHLEALKKHGPSPAHRLSFMRPVKS